MIGTQCANHQEVWALEEGVQNQDAHEAPWATTQKNMTLSHWDNNITWRVAVLMTFVSPTNSDIAQCCHGVTLAMDRGAY